MLNRVSLLAFALAVSVPGDAVARPFLDSANGNCLICDLFSRDADAGAAQDDSQPPEPDEQSDSLD